MMRRLGLLSGSAAALMTLGCGTEVGDDYTGEVLLEINGSVETDLPIDEDSALVLTSPGPNGIHLVDGVIEGDFPSAFRFSTNELPPETESLPMGDKVVDVAWMGFAVVPADHPPSVPVTGESYWWESNPEGITAGRTWCQGAACSQPCAGGQGCYTQDLRCQATPCELVESEGDASILDESVSTVGREGELGVPGGGRYSWAIDCDVDSPDRCYRQVYRCDTSEAGENAIVELPLPLEGSPAQVLSCEVTDATGDASVRELNLMTSVEANFGVVWVSEDAEVEEFGALKAGYNIIKFYDSVESWIEFTRCMHHRAVEAMAEYNATHGTSYAPFVGATSYVEDSELRAELDVITDQVIVECQKQTGQGVVTDPAGADLAIEIVHVPDIHQ